MSSLWAVPLILSGCDKAPQETPHLAKSTMPETRPYYQMDPAVQQQLFSDANSLKLGMNKKDVESLIGHPTRGSRIVSKEGVFRVYASYYYIQIWEKSFVNEVNDHYIRLSFDADEKLVVIQTNIPELQSIATKPLANALGK